MTASAIFKVTYFFFLLAMATSSCFADLSRQEIAGLVEEKDSKNTQLATKTAFSLLKDFDEISKEELNELLVDSLLFQRKGKKTEETTIKQH